MSIQFFSEDVDIPSFNKDEAGKWLTDVIVNHQFLVGDVNIIFCSDSYLLDMNREYLQHDYYTDIITFNYSEQKSISGDLFISVDTIKSNSELFNVSFLSELHRVMVHGILHLIGFDDTTDTLQKEMTAQENLWLSKLNLV